MKCERKVPHHVPEAIDIGCDIETGPLLLRPEVGRSFEQAPSRCKDGGGEERRGEEGETERKRERAQERDGDGTRRKEDPQRFPWERKKRRERKVGPRAKGRSGYRVYGDIPYTKWQYPHAGKNPDRKKQKKTKKKKTRAERAGLDRGRMSCNFWQILACPPRFPRQGQCRPKIPELTAAINLNSAVNGG